MNTKGTGSENATLCVGGYALMYLYIISTVKEILHSHIGPRGWNRHNGVRTLQRLSWPILCLQAALQSLCSENLAKKSLFCTKQKRPGGPTVFSHSLQK